MDITMTQDVREKVINSIKTELQSVIDNMDSYIPNAIILEGASFFVQIDPLNFTTVKTSFEHLGK
ncbi:MAG: hypothetical protein IJ113_02360 [Eggerthellaceae bacterium]|nr:hypothetical protein [Eggerthellaceae bacterium]